MTRVQKRFWESIGAKLNFEEWVEGRGKPFDQGELDPMQSDRSESNAWGEEEREAAMDASEIYSKNKVEKVTWGQVAVCSDYLTNKLRLFCWKLDAKISVG